METVLEAGECENLMTGEWDGGGDVGEGVGEGWIQLQSPEGIPPFSLISPLPLLPPTVPIRVNHSHFSGRSNTLQTFLHAVPSARSALSAPFSLLPSTVQFILEFAN